MTETPAFLADRLKSEGDKTIAFFNSLKDENWEITVYTEGSEWTMRNVLAHFVSAEQGFIRLFKDILAGGKGAADDFDIDRYNAKQQELIKDASRQELVKFFQAGRFEMISLVGRLTIEDLQREGRHPFLGLTTLAEMIKMVYRHNQIHHRDLRKLIDD
jgi:uncharacterized damage-inducible protein DinB